MATMTRKEFVLQVTEALQKNPRAVLAGHGIPAVVLKLIASRPDVIAKLAVILWSTKYFKKGAKGLKKSLNFKISGYKNFQDFNKRARQDVENFMAGLAPADQTTFTNNDSILTLIMLPDAASGEEDVDITFGKSVAVGFDKAVKKEYKIPGGIYVTIMWGDSAIRPVEEKKAAVKSKINARKQAKRTPAKIKMELTRKAKAKLEKIAAENEKLQGKRKKTSLELEEIKEFAGHLGVKGKTERDIIGGIKGYSGEMRALVAKLSGPKKALFKKAVALVREGKVKEAEVLLDKINVKRITDLVLNRQGQTQISKVQEARIKAMRKEIRTLSRSNEQLLVDMSLAPTASLKSSIRQKMKRQLARINELKAKLKVYEKTFTISGLRNKAKMISDTNKRIEANLAKGMSINTALANAIAALEASDGEKQEIKDTIMEEIAEGTPMQFAVQSAVQQRIQENPVQQVAQQVPAENNQEYGTTYSADDEIIVNMVSKLTDMGLTDYDSIVDAATAICMEEGIAYEDTVDGEDVSDYLTRVVSEALVVPDEPEALVYTEDSLIIDDAIGSISVKLEGLDDYDSTDLQGIVNETMEELGIVDEEMESGTLVSDYLTNFFISGAIDATGADEDVEEIVIEDTNNGFERDNLDLAGNAYNDYVIDHEPEDRPSEDEIMSYFIDACNVAGVDAGEMTAAYDAYHNNVENYMATSVGAPSAQDLGGDFDTSLVGNSTIDDILAML